MVLRNTGNTGIEAHPSGLRTGRNSGAAAINLAVHFGAARILLLGYDMGHRPGQVSHFFGEHPERLRGGSAGTYVPMFTFLVEPLKALGIEILNCSRQTALECFPRVALHDALTGVAA